MKKLYLILLFLLCSCKSIFDINSAQLEVKPSRLEVIGAVEQIYVLPMVSAFDARVDTGAQTSSIGVFDVKRFERDGASYVSFYIINRQTNEKHFFEKKIKREMSITRVGKDEDRIVVDFDVKFANKIFQKEFSLNNREKFEYQVLIGRNILKGNFVVDVSTQNTKY